VKRCVCVGLFAALMANAAQAADLGPRGPAFQPALPYSWSGFYLGANAGYGFAHETAAISAGGTIFNASQDLDGGLAGFQAGANSQWGVLVLGLEADFDWSWQNKTYGASVPGVSVTITNEIPWLATMRGRAGIAIDQWLVYATAGLALTEMKTTGSVTVGGATTSLSLSEPQAAFVWGAGIETALWGSAWTGKIEYLHVDTIDLAKTYSGIGASSQASNSIVRLGMNYRFGGR
jgi:outer membrane immunogenic protein